MIVTPAPHDGAAAGDLTVLYSATDLTAAATCEFALVRRLDAKLGRCETPPDPDDPMLERAARLGDAHELRVLEEYRARFGPHDAAAGKGVAEIGRPPSASPELLSAAAAESVAALRAGADVVFQAAFFDGRFLGYADFLVREGDDAEGRPRYAVVDTKLARRAKVTALLQVAAYADQLAREGVPVSDEVHLLLGDGSTSTHRLRDLLPVYLDRRARLQTLLDSRLEAPAVEWGDPGYAVCGRCEVCAPEVEAHRDLLLVAGLRLAQRDRLRRAGLATIDALAASSGPVEGIGSAALEALRDQARMQVGGEGQSLRYRVYDAAPLAALPAADEGDVFFDFEGDPLHTEGDGREWGLDYLFGLVEHDPDRPGETVFRPFWAHDHAEEKEALRGFLDHVTERLRRHPGMHVYHYADYERAHLQALCARHGVGEEQLDELLRRGVLVDLYPLVRRSIRVSGRSYGLKKLEPLYMGDLLRESQVTTGADSITAYVDYTELRRAGREDPVAAEAARAQLQEIADYNEYDCLSTLRLRDWLHARAAENGVQPDPPLALRDPADEQEGPPTRGEAVAPFEPSGLHERLLAGRSLLPAAPGGGVSADQQALALAAAAIDYHRREEKSFWWEHYNRLDAPVHEWAEGRDVLVVSEARVERDWEVEPGRRAPRRQLVLRGELGPGSRLDRGATRRFLVYDPPHPWIAPRSRPSDRVAHDRTEVTAVTHAADGASLFHLSEGATVDAEPYTALPIALVPAAPPRTTGIQSAIAGWGRSLVESLPRFPSDPAVDLLRRRPPRLRQDAPIAGVLPARDPGSGEPLDPARRILDTLLALDDSYLAVQGPPGTGKTYTGAHVIAELVRRHGWTVGVVAQSHAVVENMLTAVVEAGLDPARVGKATGAAEPPFTALKPSTGLGSFLSDAARDGRGVVVGGTAWDFTNTSRVPRRRLDLLVVDEAGQYSLANTIAVSVAARRLLLIGDPQQLPQVSQGVHPEPVDLSALGWLSAGHEVLPERFGVFLDRSWRLHPALCEAVSELSYEGELHSAAPATLERRLDGVAPGLHPVPLEHDGDSTSSEAEARRVVEIAATLIGREWDDRGVRRPLGQTDLIVVAPYNAQVDLVRARLDEAGLAEVPVGTVDLFQGREAVVSIVTLAASSAVEVPRGIEFLLMKNRLNVAISRARWAAFLVHSPALAGHLPHTAEQLAALSGFLRLSRAAPSGPSRDG
ncbi:TM0106 family RecB-like putative nuclease [Herbiconiux moechotypicola]|uniref:TM0106 family RecB-like putative nuclease n=1 Tax=Herbiconiux moechotypicola TaxID=637393 RepID=A0ABP5Q224_9MICO|nr:bifunctional RecB family nuclease/DEAD/DEAH box helicase [Herbiconiux moechotypicola]MCS5728347.1 TM0106 family RecB-like putative nuclease [Herbiconiux moechotypicola]